MNDRDLDLALDRLGAQHVRRTAPPALRERVRTVPTQTPPRRSWLPRIDTRGFTMFSALKFVAAAVIVALFGGFLLSGVLTTPQGDEVVPAAATESPAQPEAAESGSSAPLSFTMPYMAQTKVPTVDFDEARRRYRGAALEGPIDSGDPRLSGTLWLIDNFDAYMDSQGRVAVGIVGIDNEDGTWRGTELGYARPYESSSYFQLILTGEGAHEGLSAILFFTDNGTDFDVEGMVFPGELPPMPEAPAE